MDDQIGRIVMQDRARWYPDDANEPNMVLEICDREVFALCYPAGRDPMNTARAAERWERRGARTRGKAQSEVRRLQPLFSI